MGRTQVYITEKDEKEFKSIKSEIRQLWYTRHQQALSFSAVIMKSMIFFRDYLKGIELEKPNDNKRKNIYKYERIRK